KKGAPLIAIPTTGGTGSETTPYTIITDTSSDVKMLIGSEHIIPDIAIIDPTLTLSCPPDLTAAVGIDALCHAIEAYVSKKANPMSDIFALEAIRLLYNYLKTAYIDGSNLEAREKVMMGATLAGMAFGNSSVTLVHGMSRPIGANFHIPHGVSNATLLKVVMDFSYSSSLSSYSDIARVMDKDMSNMKEEDAAKKAVDLVAELISDLNIPSLAKLGIEKEKLRQLAPSMAKAAIDSGSPGNNPRIATEEEIIELYLKAY
ncbi:MAG: iron-containing alcohol dehydrogenase, partial [Actinomycetia bacterium]|nr:iron-containing alcohol dehydrogenase [Actinomycetes bacterium]